MSSPALSRVIEGFILHQSASGRSPNTIRNYKGDLLRFQDYLENCEVKSITPQQIESFFVYLKNDFRITHVATTPIAPKKISQKTLSNAHGTLAVFWKWVCNEYNLKNPFKVAPIQFYSKPILPLKNEEINKLLLQCKATNKTPSHMKSYSSQRVTAKRDRALILTLLDTGMRVSELCQIRMRDIDQVSGKIFITGKGNKSRFVFLGKVSRQAVWSYVSERFPKDNPYPDEPLFTDKQGIHFLNRQAVLKLLQRLGKRAELSNVHPHKFRHTFAIEFLRNGGNVFELQQLLGHSDLETAKKYVNLAQSDLETSIRKASPVDRWQIKP
jgi:integrase/recombinase XerD